MGRTGLLTADEVLALLDDVGVAAESARVPGAVTLTHAIAGEPIAGSWWGHPDGNAIYNTLNEVRDADDVTVCTLLRGKVTYVHRRLWPALVRLADAFDAERLAAVSNVHMPDGHHEKAVTAFPDWVDDGSMQAADDLDDAAALAMLPEVLRPPLRQG